MKRPSARPLRLLTSLAFLVLAPIAVLASDHADPTDLTDPYSNITGLFFFPKGDQYIMIFNVRRALTAPKPYPLSPYEYVVNFDLTTPVKFDKDDERARYGGSIPTPEKIHPDVTFTMHLNDDVTLKSINVKGLKDPDKIKVYTGVRDDPFIFPRFFKVNIITMAFSIPKDAFPADQQDFILWGTTSKDGKQLDHVGRSIRTQLPRFGWINLAPPSEHVKILMEKKAQIDKIYNFIKGTEEWYVRALADVIEPFFLIRKYDLVPDVMVYSNRYPPVYPNGRQLADDVVAQTCDFGDCLLRELSFIEGDWPRATANDKAFLDTFPYQAEPWPEKPEAPPPTKSILPYLIGAVLLILIVSWLIVEIVRRLILWLLRGLRGKAQPA
jgi:hypothetical protein